MQKHKKSSSIYQYNQFKIESTINFDFDYLPQDVMFLLAEEDQNICKFR